MTLVEKVKLVVELCGDITLNAGEKVVATILVLHFHNTVTGECFPSLTKLAEMSGVSKSTARRAVYQLRRAGVITFARNNGGRNRRNQYTFERVSELHPLASDAAKRVSPVAQKGSAGETKRVSPADPHISQEENTGSEHTKRAREGKTLADQQGFRGDATEGLQQKPETEAEMVNRLFWEKRGKLPDGTYRDGNGVVRRREP